MIPQPRTEDRPATILVVDDDPPITRALRITLAAHGYRVHTAATGAEALRTAADEPISLVILDLGLPDLDGTAVLAELRRFSTVPVIVLTGRSATADVINALDAGADDYLTKPFAMGELLARIRVALRHGRAAEPTGESLIRTDAFTVDLAAKKVIRDGVPVHLSPTEWEILEVLIRHRGHLVAQQQLLRDIWGEAHLHDLHYLRVYLAQLRRKLEPEPTHPRHLVTQPGMGYRFDP